MKISRKIGLSFFVTFLLVIFLGGLSVYSLREMYRGLGQVFEKDLPSARITYEVSVSMEEVLSELDNFLITGNENFKIALERSYKKLQDRLSSLKKFIFKEKELALFEEIEILSQSIEVIAKSLFKNKEEMGGYLADLRKIEEVFTKNLDSLFEFEANKILQEKDLLLIQAQYIPASALIIEAKLRFLNLVNTLVRYVSLEKRGEEVFLQDIFVFTKSIRDYKNYYGYSLSDKERTFAAELIELSGQTKSIVEDVIDLKKEIRKDKENLLAREKDFTEAIDKMIASKKSGISSKLGVGATLTEDIPAIYNIFNIKKDIRESWRISGKYILTHDPYYRDLYYELRKNIDRQLKDYARHARLRGTEEFLEDVTLKDADILNLINSNMKMLENRVERLDSLLSTKAELEEKIDELLQHNDSLVRAAQSSEEILDSAIPSRWVLIRFKDSLSSSIGLVINYLGGGDGRYKERYSELYFDMKKYVYKYRNMAIKETEKAAIKEVERKLDRFNILLLDVFDSHENIMKKQGWTLIKLEESLKKSLDKVAEADVVQIERNKKDIKNRLAVINTLVVFIIGVVAIIAVFIVFYTINSITNPIKKLYNGAEIIGRGNLDYRLDIHTGDEIQDLAEGFNNMASELKGFYTSLENKVKERTLQLAEANEALAVKNKELDDFTYIVSHDLKEPLRGVKAFTKLFMEEYSDKVDKEGQEYLNTIADSSSRMTHLIEDLLNLSRIGRIKNMEPDINLDELLLDVKKNLAYSLEEKNVDLKIEKTFPKVTCDKIRISEVFSNLISNAIKYSKKDTKPIIELGYTDKTDMYEFYVKDNGIGIEEEYYDKVFQIFQRLHAKGGEYEGTGAGLTIVKKIIENHGGKIWVSSKAGEGSTFYFTLPKKTG